MPASPHPDLLWRSFFAPVWGRTALFCGVLSALLGLLQFLRLGPVLVEAGPALWALLALIPYALPSLLPITLSASWMLALYLTLGDRTQTGWWLALRLQGEPFTRLGRPLVLHTTLLSCIVAACALCGGPWGLQVVSQRMADVYVFQRVNAQPNRPVSLSQTLSISARSATQHELLGVWFAHTPQVGCVVTGRARRATLQSSRVVLYDVSLRRAAVEERGVESCSSVRLSHERVEIELPSSVRASASSRWQRYIPHTERIPTHALLNPHAHPSISTHRAHTALSKRLALGVAPWVFTLCALACARLTRTGSRSEQHSAWGDLGVLGALVGVGGFYGALRAGELIAHTGAWVGWVVALPCGLVGGPMLWAVHRAARRW